MTGGKSDCKSAGIPGAQLKVENPEVGTNTYKGAKGFEVKVTVRNLTQDDPSVAGDQTGNEVFDFEASRGVYGVVVKGGPKTNNYNYMPSGKSSDTGLHSNVNPNNQKFYDLSHISFCYNPCPPSPTPSPTKPTIPTLPTKPPTVPTLPTKPPTSQPSQPTQPTSQPTQPSQPTVPTEEPSETPTNPAPTGTPTEPGEDDTATPGIPTEVDAGTGGDGSNGINLMGNDNGGGGGALAAGLLTLGGVLLAVGALVFGLRRGQHSL